ncbi:MAG TPA: M20/M25/M40 family metallo-hydrolase [Pyrinomonadaceae bacterium]|nr:M20/M25/M40 family metallo-hydrolase [Pyrinomonadaceae bacterium]
MSEEVIRDARRLLKPFENQIVELLQKLVRTDSVAIPPDGSETRGQLVLLEFLKAHNVDAELYDLEFLARSNHPYVRTDRNYKDRHNLIARINGSGQGRSLLLSGHMDTVPVGRDQWIDGPWSGAIQNDRLYGRGSYDMKGGLVAAFAVAAALKKAGVQLTGDFLCESVIDEEWGGGGGSLGARLRGDVADACVIPEPTDLKVYHASRGGSVVDIEVRAGDPENYFSKNEVLSPAIPIGRLLNWIDNLSITRREIEKGEAYRNFSDPAPVQVLAIEANSFDTLTPLSVPLTGRVRLYLQFLPHEDVASVIEEIKTSFDSFCDGDSFFNIYRPEWKPLFDPPLLGHEIDFDHQWTRTLSGCAAGVLEVDPQVTGAQFPCDAFLNQRYFGIPTLIFGPRGGGAHNANEFVELKSVLQTAEVLLAAALTWCGAAS